MNIRLPTQFYYSTNDPDVYAYVDDGILYINGPINFDSLMYNLTYAIYGYNRCYYCNCVLNNRNRSLDHIHPRAVGGISLTDNLLPTCKSCNGEKADMTPDQYQKFLKITSDLRRKEFVKQCELENDQALKEGRFLIPSEWITNVDVSSFQDNINFNVLDSERILKHTNFFKSHHNYMHPIVISSNNWVLKGLHVIYQSKKWHRSMVPAIILDNVVVLNIEDS